MWAHRSIRSRSGSASKSWTIRRATIACWGCRSSRAGRKKNSDAADRAAARVRASRPGPSAAQWQSLLDQIKGLDRSAHFLLVDPQGDDQEAADLWKAAAAVGAAMDLLTPLLHDDILESTRASGREE